MRADYPGVGQCLWLALALWMAELLAYALLMASGQFSRDEGMSAWVLATILGNGLVCVSYLVTHGLRYRDVLHPAPASAKATVLLLAGPIALVLPAVYLMQGLIAETVVWLFPLDASDERLFTELAGSGVASTVGVVLVAPFVEELLFRGIMLRGLLRSQSPVRAIVISSLIFGAAHLNVYQFIGAGSMGLLLGWIYLRFRSVLPCILLHAMYNAAVLATPESSWGDGSLMDAVPGLLWAVAIVAAAAGAAALRALARRAAPGRDGHFGSRISS